MHFPNADRPGIAVSTGMGRTPHHLSEKMRFIQSLFTTEMRVKSRRRMNSSSCMSASPPGGYLYETCSPGSPKRRIMKEK